MRTSKGSASGFLPSPPCGNLAPFLAGEEWGVIAFKKAVASLVDTGDVDQRISARGTWPRRNDTKPRLLGTRLASVKHPLDEFLGANDRHGFRFPDEPHSKRGIFNWHVSMCFDVAQLGLSG